MSVENPTTSSDTELEAPRALANSEEEIPRMDAWLWVLLSALGPVLLAFVLPRAMMVLLFGASGLLLLIGLILFVAHERRNRRAG